MIVIPLILLTFASQRILLVGTELIIYESESVICNLVHFYLPMFCNECSSVFKLCIHTLLRCRVVFNNTSIAVNTITATRDVLNAALLELGFFSLIKSTSKQNVLQLIKYNSL